ncbi:topoisomerase C-terminal repeat-containing protein, partial [Bartonella sp. MR168JLCBS]|uniref:topoisomerase C-terminal repeat-containing protein n=1 Tax=Bartonella sp. MR168JLCBS TaxID=3243556 RepID=UPI0035D065D1
TDPGEENEVRRNDEPVMLGIDPKTGKDVSLRNGRFGPYIQVGEQKEAKRIGLPKEWQTEKMTLDKALALISLPRETGIHPE